MLVVGVLLVEGGEAGGAVLRWGGGQKKVWQGHSKVGGLCACVYTVV